MVSVKFESRCVIFLCDITSSPSFIIFDMCLDTFFV
jgi:hypothetical protein